ncbi:MAG: arylsulfatase [Agriterribacter sp.]
MPFRITLIILFSILTLLAKTQERLNVILIMTDDQGYGDLGCHGNPVIKTPHIDAMHKRSVSLTDFHVSPTCSPTRSSLMTGRYTNKNGVWHTLGGCSFLRKGQVTMGDVFSRNGYKTGMFGKWHLGDVYPSRPEDKGFGYVVRHGGGGVGQTPDYWGNDYFDDTYFVNSQPKKFEGYCTDVWFDEAIQFIDKSKNAPFFCYIATNAPHGPLNVPEKYYTLYKSEAISEEQKRFYGMISNVDDNIGKLNTYLKKQDLLENTIVIYMTDNGSAGAFGEYKGERKGFNAGMRGGKGGPYEGGHRVPFFMQLPESYRVKNKSIDNLTAHIDVLPTLAAFCNFYTDDLDLDGVSFKDLLLGKKNELPRDYIVTDTQRDQAPVKWRTSAVMHKKWRLINGKELYDLEKDPSQKQDIASENSEIVNKLKGFYDEWWGETEPALTSYPRMIVGSSVQPVCVLTCFDAHGETEELAWNQDLIRNGIKNAGTKPFSIHFDQSGNYRIELSRWPFEADMSKPDTYLKGRMATPYTNAIPEGKKLDLKSAYVKVDAWQKMEFMDSDTEKPMFTGYFEKGDKDLSAWFLTGDNKILGAYYVRITRLSNSKK